MEEQLVNREIKFNVPKKLTKAEFENTIKFFKENGAKYHVDEKIWTIKESQREKFAQYLNPENMHAAHKNEPQSPEERVRLNIPKNLDKDEFLRMIQYFKENGAKYQPDEKVWTIGKSQKDSFEKYIMTDTNESNSTLGNVEEIKLSEEEINMLEPESAENMKQFFLDHGGVLKDSMWIVPKSAFELEKAVPESNIQETMNKKEEFTNKLDQLLREYGYDKGYAYSMDLAEMISKETLHMPPEPEVEVAEAESSTSLNSTATVQTTDREGNYRKGNYVSLHVPDYKTAVYEIKEVCGIKEISGQILAETQDHLILEGKDGKEISVAKKEIYDEMQTSIVEKAMSMDQNVRDQIDLIGNPKLSAPQMDQILNGINDGLQPLLVAQYANPKIPAWQMDIYRYGMLNGLGYDQIKVGCLQDWDSSRNNIDNMIKEQRGHIVSDLKANNYHLSHEKYGVITRNYYVFNGRDIEGIPELQPQTSKEIVNDELIDKIQKGMDLQILNDGGDRAYYSPKTDSVHLPEKDTFYNSYAYNATALHELSHATGAEKRLNRDIKNAFGTEKYAYEELVAEISACFMSEHIQIEQTEEHVNNHKAYIQSWTKALSEKPEMLMKAIRDAEKAANYLEYHAEILSKEEYQETLTLHENEETPGNTSGKTVEKITNSITREADLKANGYKLTPALKKHMDRLDQLTGRKNTVKDIYKAYKTHDFHGDPEMEKTIKSIGKIFQRQEMQIKAVIPER